MEQIPATYLVMVLPLCFLCDGVGHLSDRLTLGELHLKIYQQGEDAAASSFIQSYFMGLKT